MSLAVAAAVCLVAAGCGGSAGPGVARIGSTTSTTGQRSTGSTGAATTQAQALLAFARCMRRHGVPAFPNPEARPDGTYGFATPSELRRLVRGHRQALTACQTDLARAGITSARNLTRFRDDMLSFSRCMRSHGVKDFPDPNADGRFGGQLKGLDRNAPAYRRALAACRSDLTAAIGVFSVAGGSP